VCFVHERDFNSSKMIYLCYQANAKNGEIPLMHACLIEGRVKEENPKKEFLHACIGFIAPIYNRICCG